MSGKRDDKGAFAVIENSGAVSVKLGKFLKSDTAKDQLRGVKRLRQHTQHLLSERDAFRAVLAEIVYEYRNSYDADCEPGGSWKSAASIPVDLMERAAALVGVK